MNELGAKFELHFTTRCETPISNPELFFHFARCTKDTLKCISMFLLREASYKRVCLCVGVSVCMSHFITNL